MHNTNIAFSQKKRATIALLFISFIWGSSFPIAKYILFSIPVFTYLAIRFFCATCLFLPFCFKYLTKTKAKDWCKSLLIGCFLFAGFALQTIGLKMTTATKTSFISGLYVVFVPFLYTFICKKALPIHSIAAAICASIGLFLMGGSVENFYIWDVGILLVLISCVFIALQILAIAHFASTIPTNVLAFGQLLSTALLSVSYSLYYDDWQLSSTSFGVWGAILFLSIFATVLAYYVQCKMQQYIDPTATAIIFSLECIFGAILSILFLDEGFDSHIFIASILLTIAMLLAQMSPNPE